jgi:hypothetical protein
MIYLIYCKNFYKYHNITPPRKTIKKKEVRVGQSLLEKGQRRPFLDDGIILCLYLGSGYMGIFV